MGLQPPLRRLGIVGRDHQQPVRTLGRTSLGQPDAVRGVIGAGTGDNTGPVPTASKTARSSSIFSPSVVVGDSPVVPETTRPSHP